MIIPIELILKILDYLPIEYQDQILYLIFPNFYSTIFKKKRKFISNFSNQILELFGGTEKMLNYPILKYQTRFCQIDYIDEIKLNDVYNNIMIGIDDWSRPFIVIKYNVKNFTNLETLFQRYTGEKNTWTIGTNYHTFIDPAGYFLDRGILNTLSAKNISRILENNFNY